MRIIRALAALAPAVLVTGAPACAGERPAPSTHPPQVESTAPQADVPDEDSARLRKEREEAARKRVQALPRPAPAPAAAEPAMPAPAKLERVLQDAANRAGLAPGTVKVVSSERVTWSDGSLGCPVGGQFYTQMLVAGYRVLVAAGDSTLDYRLADSGFFKLCPEGASLEIPGGGRVDR